MSFLLCLGLLALAPSLAYAANLEIPGNGDKLSGIGVISGWQCRAGTVTVRLDGGEPLPTQYGLPRADTIPVCRDDGYNGFVTYWNWAILGDGWHTAVAYDNGVEFDRSTFTVATTGEEFLTQDSGRAARAQIPDFPSPGEITWFEWNTSTQHLETVASDDIRGWCLSPGLAEPGVPDTVARQPVLRPPPLPCPRAQRGDFDGYWYIRFYPPPSNRPPDDVMCTAARGVMRVEIEDGRIRGSTRTPPFGSFRVSGEVCAHNGLYVGQWLIDDNDDNQWGIFTGSLGTDTCEAKWEDSAGCAGRLEIFQLPRTQQAEGLRATNRPDTRPDNTLHEGE